MGVAGPLPEGIVGLVLGLPRFLAKKNSFILSQLGGTINYKK